MSPPENFVRSVPGTETVVRNGGWELTLPGTERKAFLNPTARELWQRCRRGTTSTFLAESLRNKYGISGEQAEQDVRAFCRDLERAGFLLHLLPAPADLCVGITTRCNLSCRHCLAYGGAFDFDPEFSRDEMIRVFDEFAKIGVSNLSVFGGEPLLSPHFFDYLAALRERGIGMALNTNATLVTAEKARRIKELVAGPVVASFDGSCPGIMDRIRGTGSFAQAAAGIRHLVAAGCHVLLSCTVNKINILDLETMAVFGREKLQAHGIRFNHTQFDGNAACFADELHPSVGEDWQAVLTATALREKYGDFVSGTYVTTRALVDQRVAEGPLGSRTFAAPPCGAGVRKCCLRPDGWVTPCEVLWYLKAGNVRKQAFQEIWLHSEVMNKFRLPLRHTLEKGLEDCADCKYGRLCYHGHRCTPFELPGGVKEVKKRCWKTARDKSPPIPGFPLRGGTP